MNEKVVSEYVATFKQSDFGRLCLCHFTINGGKTSSNTVVWCSNKQYAFVLERETPEKPWIVKNAAQQGTSSFDQRTVSNNGMFRDLWVCTGVVSAHGKELLKRPSFTAVSETVVGDPKDGHLRVEFTDEAGQQRFPVGGRIVFDTKHHWLVLKAETRYHFPEPGQREDQLQELEFQYQPTGSGELMPVAMRLKSFTLDKKETRGGWEHAYDFSLSPIPSDSEFKFTAFGLPELFSSPSRPWYSYYYIWVLAGAIVCLGSALMLRKWLRTSGEGAP